MEDPPDMDHTPDNECHQVFNEQQGTFSVDSFSAIEDRLDEAMQSEMDGSQDMGSAVEGEQLRGFRKRWMKRSTSPATRDESQDGAAHNMSIFERWAKKLRLDKVRDEATCSKESAVDEQAISNVMQTAELESMRRFRTHSIKLPWETGPWSMVFGQTQQPAASSLEKMLTMPKVGLVDTLGPSMPSTVAASSSLPMPSRFAHKRIVAAKVVIREDEMRAKALNQIRTLLLFDLAGSDLGVTISNLAGTLDEKVDLTQVLCDSFAAKSTGAILKRVSSIWSFSRWLIDQYEISVWEINESILYQHVCYLRESGAAPTRSAHLLEALRFFDAILKFRKFDINAVISTRVQGASHAMYITKRKLKQAKQLTVEAVHWLEKMCIRGVDEARTLISGAFLFCVFGCARWSDISRLENLWVDEFEGLVLVEGESSKSKTSRTKEAQSRLLPYTAVGNFMEEESWGKAFVQAWKKANEGRDRCFIPSWNDRAATWATSPMSSTEATFFLKEFLEESLGEEEADAYSTHSGKPTLLTWCGMSGLLTREERTLLGHHIEQHTRSATTYNRDSQLLLQRKVSQVIKQIKDGILRPDVSRAERLKVLVDLDEEGEQPSESGESEYHEEDPPEIHVASMSNEQAIIPSEVVDEFSFVSHRLTGTVHVIKDAEENLLACGRRLTMNLLAVDPADFDVSTACFCIQCNSVVLRNG